MILALCMIFALCACGQTAAPAAAPAEAPAAAPAAAPAEAPAAEAVTITYWSMWEAVEPQGVAIAEEVAKFTEETGIQVDLQFKGRTGIREGLQPALDAGQVVDVFDESLDRVNSVFADYLLDLEDLNEKYDHEAYAITGLVNLARSLGGGTLKTIPYQPNMWGFFYNQAIFDEAGVTDAPTNWDEFLAVCEKIKAAGYAPLTVDDGYSIALFGTHVARLIGQDGVIDVVTNNKWDDPAVLQFAKDYEEFASKGYFVETVAGNVWPTGQTVDIGGGSAAMYYNGSWLPNEILGVTGPDFAWGCFGYPEVDNCVYGSEYGTFGASCFAINNKTEVADEAFQLIHYLTTGEADLNISTQSSAMPADVNNTEWPEIISSARPVLNNMTERWATYVSANSNADITPILQENIMKLFGGVISADEFVDNMMKAAGK